MLPVVKIVPHSMSVHADTRIENYFWLRGRDALIRGDTVREVLDYARF